MATSYYSTGSVTLTNGSAVVTGNGTGWQLALISGGNVIVQAPGNVLPIASVDSDTQITAELEWTGANGTYSYTIQRDTAYLKSLDQNSESLSYLISEMRNGTLFKYDASGDFVGRGLYDTKPKGFGYLVTIGVSEPDFYVKGSNADGDWEGPFAYGQGPVGPQGPIGFLEFKGDYNPASTYVPNDGVRRNGSSWVAIQNVPVNTPPPNVPGPDTAYWALLAVKGQDGTGIGDMLASVYDPQDRQLPFATVGDASGMAGLRNKILNPLGQINQESVSGTVTLTPGKYGHDGFKAGASGCTYTFAQTNGVTVFNITSGSLQQPIEASSFAGEPGTYFLGWVGTAQGRINGGTYGTSGNVSAICDGSSNVTVEWGVGTVSLMQLERGFLGSFSARARAHELALCQRYFETDVDAPFLSVAAPGVVAAYGKGFRVTKRDTPTITLSEFTFVNGSGQASDFATTGGFRFLWSALAAGPTQLTARWKADARI